MPAASRLNLLRRRFQLVEFAPLDPAMRLEQTEIAFDHALPRIFGG